MIERSGLFHPSPAHQSLLISDIDAGIILRVQRTAAVWGFVFTVVAEGVGKSRLTLLGSPAIFGIQLTAEDLLEYSHALTSSFDGVEAHTSAEWLKRVRPPAVQHILCSKVPCISLYFMRF